MADSFVFTPNHTCRLWLKKLEHEGLAGPPDYVDLPIRILKPYVDYGYKNNSGPKFFSRFHISPIVDIFSTGLQLADELFITVNLDGFPLKFCFILYGWNPIIVDGELECWYVLGYPFKLIP